MRALLIIDMQKGSFQPYSLRHDTWNVIDRINTISGHFREAEDLVIFIQHDGSKEKAFIPGTEDWEILPELIMDPDDLFVSKTANDSFYNTDLDNLLAWHDIKELVITGCATDFCVDTTIKSALSKDYQITVIGDAHTTADRPNMDATTLIKYFNWLWADMTPTEHKVRVVDTNSFLSSVT